MNELGKITKRYFLGELSDQEQDWLEERYFRDPKLFDAVLQLESELVDVYARGQLSTDIRERFEKSYLNHPPRGKRVNFAKALTTRIDQREQSVTRVEQSARSALPSSRWKRLFVIVGNPAGARFVFKVSARPLTSGDYTLTLGGITTEGEVDDLSRSLFRVEKK